MLHLRPLGRIGQPLHRFAGNIIAVCSRLLLGRAAAARGGLCVGLRRLVALRGAARHFRVIGRFFLPIARHILLVLRLLALIFGQLPLIFHLRLLPLRFFIGFLLRDALLLGLIGLLLRDALLLGLIGFLLGDTLLLGLGLLPRLFLHLLLPCVDLRAAALHLGRARPFRAHGGIALGFGHALGGLRAVSHAGVCAQLLVRHALRALHDLLRLPLVHLRLLERQPLFFFFLFRHA